MNDNIEIVIKKSEQAEDTKPQETGLDTDKKEAGKPSASQGAINTAIISAGKQVMMNSVTQYHNFTGDYHTQQQLNNALSLGADIAIIAKGGPIGLIAVGTKHAVAIGGSFVAQAQADRTRELALQRSGNIALSGSRHSR